MATLTINGRPVSADPEQTILDAARAAGIADIPTLCWYAKLPIVGNCRICLVSVEGQGKLLPACATKVADGMVVQTESHAAVENRKGVLRLLLERYPGDHLVNGGRAQPRNEFEQYVVRYGVVPTPPTLRDLPLRHGDERPGDSMIRHDMSTCILCTRCVRACEDIQVVGVLDVGQRGEHTEIIVGADGDPDRAGCTWCGECVRVCPTGAIFEVMPRERFAPEQVRHPDKIVRSVCPYCGVGCQVDLHVADGKVLRVTSPDIELDTPNQGSTCVKGRFGYDFPQHRDRLTKPLIRKGWVRESGRWMWRGATGQERRGGPWQTIEGEGQNAKPAGPPRSVGKSVRELSLVERLDLDIRDRVATPPSWYAPFRGATLIVADPRKTELAGRADIHLQMQPGTDVALFGAMLNHILARGLEDQRFIAERTKHFDRVRQAVGPMTPAVAARLTGVPAERIQRAAELYAAGPNTSTLAAMGLTTHANGTELVASLPKPL